MKKSYFFILVILILAIGIGIYFYKTRRNESSSKSSTYNSTLIGTTDTNNTSNTDDSNNTTDENNNTNVVNTNNTNTDNTSQNSSSAPSETQSETSSTETETLLTEFTTKIYTKESARQNNMTITCSSLNNTIVNNGETFSFCDTVGKATSNKGYKKADVFKSGEKVKALGGGNCQVSTTLYNAVLKVPELKVTERHEHSNSVPYISRGKDAAVAYGSYDFKFINNTGNKIKILSSCDKNYVYIQINKIE